MKMNSPKRNMDSSFLSLLSNNITSNDCLIIFGNITESWNVATQMLIICNGLCRKKYESCHKVIKKEWVS